MKYYSSQDIKVGSNVYDSRIPKDRQPRIVVSLPEFGAGVEVPEPTEIVLNNFDKAISTLRSTVDLRGKSVVIKEHFQSYNEADETITQFTGLIEQTQIGTQARLDAVPLNTGFLETEIPLKRINQTDWPDAPVDDLDKPISPVFGNSVNRVPCKLIIAQDNLSVLGDSRYQYLVGKGDLTINKVYRDGKPIKEYSGTTGNGSTFLVFDFVPLSAGLQESDAFYSMAWAYFTSGNLGGVTELIWGYSGEGAGSNTLAFPADTDTQTVTSGDGITIREWRKRILLIPSDFYAVLDDFNRANEGPPPGTGWSDWTGESGLQVDTNVIEVSAGGVIKAAGYDTTFAENQYAGVTINTPSAVDGDYIELRLRWDGLFASEDYYWAKVTYKTTGGAQSVIQFGKVIAGISITMGSNAELKPALGAGERVLAAVIDQELIVYYYRDGGWHFWHSHHVRATQITGTGKVAVGMFGTTWRLDDFAAGAVTDIYTAIEFAIPQKISDRVLNSQNISADATGLQTERNPVRALEYWIDEVGAAKNATAFTNVAAEVPTGLYIDGTLSEPRRLVDVLNDIALVGRVRLILNSSGEFEPVINEAQSSLYGLFNTANNNLMNFEAPLERSLASLYGNVSVKYRKTFIDNEFLLESAQHAAVAAGKRDLIIESDWITDKTTADMIADFVAKWLAATDTLYTVRLGLEARQRVRGELIKLDIPELGVNGDYQIFSQAKEGIYEFMVFLYDLNVFTHSPGTLPADPIENEEDSLVFEPPDDPKNLVVETNGATFVVLQWDAPTIIAKALHILHWFVEYKLSSASDWQVEAAVPLVKNTGGSGYETEYRRRINGLTTATNYDFRARAVSLYGVFGGMGLIEDHTTA